MECNESFVKLNKNNQASYCNFNESKKVQLTNELDKEDTIETSSQLPNNPIFWQYQKGIYCNTSSSNTGTNYRFRQNFSNTNDILH